MTEPSLTAWTYVKGIALVYGLVWVALVVAVLCVGLLALGTVIGIPVLVGFVLWDEWDMRRRLVRCERIVASEISDTSSGQSAQ